MKQNRLYIKYILNGNVYEDDRYQTLHYIIEESYENDRLILTLTPRERITLIAFELRYKREFKTDDLFFVNGYQSWSTSGEYTVYDKRKGLTKLTNLVVAAKPLAAISGEYLFKKDSNKAGVFHSYTYTYIRNGENVEFWGSLSEKAGFTVFNCDMKEGDFTVEKDVDGAVCDSPVVLLDIVRYNGAYDEVFDKYFDTMGLKKPQIDHLAGYTSWYSYFQDINEEIILRDLKGLAKIKDVSSIYQIDDGYEPFIGDWLDSSPKFPNGMKFLADKIHEEGFLAGIWLAPFNAQKGSRIAREHPEWLIKRSGTEKPLRGCAPWGGAYTLDFYIPEARAYIKSVFDEVFNVWGYDMVKLDFLYSECMEPRNGKSRGTIMCEAMEFLRECCGDKLILGCGVPLGAAFGYVDACRIGCDVDLKYPGRYYSEKLHINREVPSVRNAIQNTIFRRHLNGRAFLNDPDVFFLRDYNLKFNDEQKTLLAKINNLFGSVLFVSDDINRYGEKEISAVKKAFKKSNAIIISAEYTDKDYITINYLEDGEKKKLTFDIKTGENNLD